MIRSLTTNFRRLFSTDKAKLISPVTSNANENVNNYSANITTPVYTSSSIRTGALGIKKGMMSYWDTWGKRHPVTILHVTKTGLLFLINPSFLFLVRSRSSFRYFPLRRLPHPEPRYRPQISASNPPRSAQVLQCLRDGAEA